MKKRLLWVVLFLLIATGCTGQTKPNEPVELPHGAFINRVFTVDGKVYAIRNAEGNAYITTEFSEGPLCYPLSKLNGGYGDALWHAPSGRIYYSEGCAVYSCDVTGNDKKLIWRLPEGKKRKDRVQLLTVSNDRLLVSGAYAERKPAEYYAKSGTYSYDTRAYFSLDITTGKGLSILRGNKRLVPICVQKNTLWAVEQSVGSWDSVLLEDMTRREKTGQILRVDLLTGERKELHTFENLGTASKACGVVTNDSLYCSIDGMFCAIPLVGGAPDFKWPDEFRAAGMDQVRSIAEYDGAIYVLMEDDTADLTLALCQWKLKSEELLPIFASEDAFYPGGFHIDGERYFLFMGDEMIWGKLP